MLGLIPALVCLLDNVAGDALGAKAKRDSRRQRRRAEQDQERRGGELHRYAQLRDGGEGRVDHDGVTGYVRQEVAAGGAPHYAGEEVGQERGENQDQDRRYYARDVGDQLREDELRDVGEERALPLL